jgi:NAD(P)-dependent dehydrogenase (short-subunit alcohol dehydrogenase family)
MSHMFDLTDRVFLVTGASSGLGARFAEVLANHGARVALGARRADRLAENVAGIEAQGGTALAVELDVTDRDNVIAALEETETALGPISGLINNAGIVRETWALKAEPEDWEAVISTNLTGCWWCAQEAAKRMAAHGKGGNIVNIASILAERVTGTTSIYAIAKAGVAQMTRALALELVRNDIQVNALAPGYIRTEINQSFFASDAGRRMIERMPMRRIGEPAELDAPLLLMASNASPFLTGAMLTVDGGQSLAMV